MGRLGIDVAVAKPLKLEVYARWFVLFLLIRGLAVAQFAEMVSNGDGSQVLFTSTMILKGAPASRPETRLYRWKRDALELLAERGDLAPRDSFTSGDGVSNVHLSSDGDVWAYTMHNICAEGACIMDRGEIAGARRQVLGAGRLQMSRNGRWALVSTDQLAELIDLSSGYRRQVPEPACEPACVSNQGVVLVRRGAGIWRDGEVTPIPLNGPIRVRGLSSNGRMMVYSLLEPGAVNYESLIARELESGQESVLLRIEVPARFPSFMGMSDDGLRVLYGVNEGQLAGRAFIADVLSGQSAEIVLKDGELATAGAISGDGRIVYLGTTFGRVVRIDPPGELRQVLPPVPFLRLSAFGHFAPGLRLTLPWRWSLDPRGRILLDGRPLFVIEADAGSATVQVDWDMQVGLAELRADVSTESPLEQRELVYVLPAQPSFEPDPNGFFGWKTIKGDWTGLLKDQPKPGETFHIYGRGFGKVRGPIPTGAAAPFDQPIPIEDSLICRLLPQSRPLETVFAGLAPGTIGFYQITFRVPEDAEDARVMGVDCSMSGIGWSVVRF